MRTTAAVLTCTSPMPYRATAPLYDPPHMHTDDAISPSSLPSHGTAGASYSLSHGRRGAVGHKRCRRNRLALQVEVQGEGGVGVDAVLVIAAEHRHRHTPLCNTQTEKDQSYTRQRGAAASCCRPRDLLARGLPAERVGTATCPDRCGTGPSSARSLLHDSEATSSSQASDITPVRPKPPYS